MPRKGRAAYARKVKKAVHLLFFRRHYKPGARGYELKKVLGPDYLRVLKVLDQLLRPLDLQVRQVFEEVPAPGASGEGAEARSPDEARYYVVLRGTLAPTELKYCGWRIDDIAALALSIALLLARGGRAPRSEVEEILSKKLPGWRVRMGIDRFIRSGYLGEDEAGVLYLDWRTMAEVDLRAFLDLLLKYEPVLPG
ncbi:hypothetical protein DRO32_00350 [Candidatus Bathyarchaeota archaeon]|nr:MAG: hypothetical protein DRO32_00350 [Candidatus Bathyarchaeota archaeon]